MSKRRKSKYLTAITAMALTASTVVMVAPIVSEASSFKDVHPMLAIPTLKIFLLLINILELLLL